MALVDNLDFELFGISNISDEFNPPFGELEDPVTGSFASQTPLSLPLIAENFEVNFLDESHINDITQDSVRPNDASMPSNGLTTQLSGNLNAVQPSTSSLPRSSSSSKPTVKRNTARSLSKAQVSGSSLPSPPTPYTAEDVSESIDTTKSLVPTQPATSEVLDEFFSTTEWNTIDLTGVPQQSPPSSPHWGSCPSIIGKPPLNVDWNPIYVALGMTSWVTSNPDFAMNDAFNEGSFSQNIKQECTEATLPSTPSPQYFSVVSTDVMDALVPSGTQSTDCDALAAQPETQPGDYVSDQDSPSQDIEQGTSTDGLFTPSPQYSSLPSTDVIDMSVPSDTQSTDYTVSCAIQSADYVADQGSPSQDIGQGTSTDGLFTPSSQYSSLPSTDVTDTPVPSDTQSTNYDASFATQPQHYACEQGAVSRDIGQRTSTNVTPPSAPSPQYSSVPSTHVERVIPSYLPQSNPIPANTDASIATQSQSRSNQTLGSPNTVPRTHNNVTQPSTASTPHFSTPGPNGQNKSTPPHPSQQVPVKNDGFSVTAPLTRGPRPRKRPQGKHTNVTQPSTAPQYSSVVSTDENTSIPSHPWQSTQVSVNNGGFFPIASQQQAFNQGPPWQGRSMNVQRQPLVQTPASQYMAGPLPMSQRAATVQKLSSGNDQGLYNNPPLNWTSGFSSPVNVPHNSVNLNFPMPSNYVVANPQYTMQQHASSHGLAQLNQDTQHTYTNLIVNNDSSVAHNQRLMNPPYRISTTGYNANANVTNDKVPPTSGVPSVDLVDRQFFHSTPSPYIASGQGGTYYPSFNTIPSGFFPDPRNHNRVVPTIPVPTLPSSTRPPAPMQTNTHYWNQPVGMLPSPPNSQPTSFSPTPSTSGPVASAAGKRKRGDDESVTDNTQKRRRGQERPESHLYQEIKKGKYICLYAGPANPHGCSAGPFTTMPSLLNHIRTVHAKREVEMNVPPAERVAYNGLPAGLRTLGVVCPLRDADLMRCKHYREHGQRWRAQTMDTPEAAVRSHIASDHDVGE